MVEECETGVCVKCARNSILVLTVLRFQVLTYQLTSGNEFSNIFSTCTRINVLVGYYESLKSIKRFSYFNMRRNYIIEA